MRKFLLAMVLAFPGFAMAQQVTGPARAIDGDSLEMTGYRIRLFGIDAPEGRQTCQRDGTSWECGKQAAKRLAELVAGAQVQCEGRDVDRYQRLVAVCRAGGLDIGRAMVESGLAIVLPNGVDDYGALETNVQKARWGLWAGEFERPSQWRAANKVDEPVVKTPPLRAAAPAREAIYRNSLGICSIKGNHSWRGDWIYHLPGTKHYAETRAEALFCTESQAQAAGYRRARND